MSHDQIRDSEKKSKYCCFSTIFIILRVLEEFSYYILLRRDTYCVRNFFMFCFEFVK